MRQFTPSPFAAKITFKPNARYQQKHEVWTFPSNLLVPKNATAEQHFKILEDIILNVHKGQFIVASLFDNRPQLITPQKNSGLQEKKNPLILQVYYDRIHVDKRHRLDLSWLEPSFNPAYLNLLAEQFAEAREAIDLEANCLQLALRSYKQNLNL